MTTYNEFDRYFEPTGIVDIRWNTWNSVVSASEIEWHDLNCVRDPIAVHSELMTTNWSDKLFIRFISWDWNTPILFANPHYKRTLQRVFPEDAAFHLLAKKLMAPSPNYRSLVDEYVNTNFKDRPYTVGLHVRTRKTPPNRRPLDIEHFVSIAQKLLLENKSTKQAVFVASDDGHARLDSLHMLQKIRPHVSIAVQKGNFLGDNSTVGGNPGTEDSAVFDLFILAQADDIICTHGSSFGHVAAGLAGKKYYSVHNERDEGFEQTDVLVTRMFAPEPCWYASKFLYEKGGSELRSAIRKMPGWEQYLQCHYYYA